MRRDLKAACERAGHTCAREPAGHPIEEAVGDRDLNDDELEFGPKLIDDVREHRRLALGGKVFNDVEERQDAWPERQRTKLQIPGVLGRRRDKQSLHTLLAQAAD